MALKDRGVDERGALVMSAIPLHLQRKFEQRWAARFVTRAASAVPKGDRLKSSLGTSPRPARAKEKPAELNKPAR
jgi:hypothetical protein